MLGRGRLLALRLGLTFAGFFFLSRCRLLRLFLRGLFCSVLLFLVGFLLVRLFFLSFFSLLLFRLFFFSLLGFFLLSLFGLLLVSGRLFFLLLLGSRLGVVVGSKLSGRSCD